jgi:hypothetical protein
MLERDPKTPDRARLRALARAVRDHYAARFEALILLERKDEQLLELLLVLRGDVNQMREILRVEPLARRFSTSVLEVAIFPVSKTDFDAALEPELWEAQFTGTRLNPDD